MQFHIKPLILLILASGLFYTSRMILLQYILMFICFSGMFPLFKPGASSLGGAYLRAHIAAKPQFGKVDQVGSRILVFFQTKGQTV